MNVLFNIFYLFLIYFQLLYNESNEAYDFMPESVPAQNHNTKFNYKLKL